MIVVSIEGRVAKSYREAAMTSSPTLPLVGYVGKEECKRT
jgi:hypothetical protein